MGVQKKGSSILCTLDWETFIEAFRLQGPMGVEIDLEKFEETFKNLKMFFHQQIHEIAHPKEKDKYGRDLKEGWKTHAIGFLLQIFSKHNFWCEQGVGC